MPGRRYDRPIAGRLVKRIARLLIRVTPPPLRRIAQQRLLEPARRKTPEVLWNVGHRFGYSVIREGAGSPIPAIPEPDDPIWSRRSDMVGVKFDLDSQLAFMTGSLAEYIEEFDRDVRGAGFDVWNYLYQAGDAHVLYALLRHLRPQRVLEIGSGNSTVVASAAMAANRRDGSPGELVAVDPFPTVALDAQPTLKKVGGAQGVLVELPGRDTPIDGLTRLERVDCRELPFERFEALQPGDVLFLDTTHIVKLDSEVNWLILEVLPRLAPGVWVHCHDTFLPYEYPWYYYYLAGFLAEQYLLQAFLTGSAWQVEIALAALFRDRHDQLIELIPSLNEAVPGVPQLKTWLPCAFWLRRPEE